MKWFVCILLGFCMQGLVSIPNVNKESSSFYFDKGVSTDFFGGKIEHLLELQTKYPGLKWEFVLVQLNSELKLLVSKRLLTLRKQFEKEGLDMKRIVFNTNPILVEDVLERYPPDPPNTLNSVGAILEGKVVSLN